MKLVMEGATFEPINRSFNSVFRPDRLSLGLVVPIEAYPHSPRPTMADHLERVQLAEALGFAAVWLRDVPFDVPSFGDAGQLYDPFVYLGLLAGRTEHIALGVASVVLPLRHPAHVAKAAASVDELSGGRLLLGIASGDRPEEYPALALPYGDRGQRFRASYNYMRQVAQPKASFDNRYGRPGRGMDLLPRPTGGKLPLLITGASQQAPDWVAENGDGWMTYPRPVDAQRSVVAAWRARTQALGGQPKPAMQPLYVDLLDDPEAPPQPIHLGFRLGSNALRRHLEALCDAGMNHVALNLRFSQTAPDIVMQRLADEVLPAFNA